MFEMNVLEDGFFLLAVYLIAYKAKVQMEALNILPESYILVS